MIHRALSPLFVALSFSAIGAAAALAACSSDPAPAGDAGADAIASDASSTDGSTNPDTSTANDASATDATTSDGGLSPTEKAICDAKASRAKCFDGSGGDPGPCSEETKCLYGRLMEPAAVTAYGSHSSWAPGRAVGPPHPKMPSQEVKPATARRSP